MEKKMDLAAADKLLTTTRSVRKRLDYSRPVPLDVIQQCIEIAIQAPTGSNQQGWSFLIVTDVGKKKRLADLYRKGVEIYAQMPQPERPAEDLRTQQRPRVLMSSLHLVQTMEQAPLFLIPCIEGRVENASPFVQASTYGSILPAVWSFMLAARARGIGAAWTTIHLLFEKEAAAILGIPDHITQVALLPVAYFTGEDFKPAKRIPSSECTYYETWGNKR
jgi:nitroreductase